MTTIRDTQRQKVYDAEDRAFPGAKHEPEGLSVEQMQALVDKWGASKVLRRRYPMAGVPVRITDGRGRRRASYFGNRWRTDGTVGPTITMPRWARSKPWLLHEYAHHLTRARPAHGWQFCETYLALVRVVMGKGSAERLKAEFKAGKVRHRAPVKRTMTEAQKQAARERMQKLNERRQLVAA